MSTYFANAAVIILCLFCSSAHAETSLSTETVLKKMGASYLRVHDYRAKVIVNDYLGNGSIKKQEFLYTFKKPNRIRMDLISPRAGWTLIYPDENGKVALRSPGLKHFFTLRLSPSSSLLKAGTDQRIDQTDMGLLIENISRSLTDKRKGPADIALVDGIIQVKVLAENHFHEGVATLYRFSIDNKSGLPVEVEESTPEGKLKRTVQFEDLMTNLGPPDVFFKLEEEKNDDTGLHERR